ncbi:MAG: hypothetical protein AAFY64_11270, partial [Pseudomonadota bacterium]
ASQVSLPIPDVMVKEGPLTGSHVADESLAMFEVLSPSNTASDRKWRLDAYASIPNCQHIIMIAPQRYRVTAFDRERNWSPVDYVGAADAVPLSALDCALALEDVYRYLPSSETST